LPSVFKKRIAAVGAGFSLLSRANLLADMIAQSEGIGYLIFLSPPPRVSNTARTIAGWW